MKYIASNEYPHRWKDVPAGQDELSIIYKIMDDFSPPSIFDVSGIEDVYVAFDSDRYFRVTKECYYDDKGDGKGSQMMSDHYFVIIPKPMCQENLNFPL